MNYLNNPKKIQQSMQLEKNSVEHVKSLMRNEVVEKGKYLCPICSEFLDCKGNLSLFNKHVDRCLSGSVPEATKQAK